MTLCVAPGIHGGYVWTELVEDTVTTDEGTVHVTW